MTSLDFPEYNLERLKQEARRKLLVLGMEPTSLGIYHLVTSIRAEELKAASKGRRLLAEVPVQVAGGMIEEEHA